MQPWTAHPETPIRAGADEQAPVGPAGRGVLVLKFEADVRRLASFHGALDVCDPDLPGTTPRRDVDLASYGLVSMLPEGPGSGYQDLGWRPRLAFEAMARLKAA
jgi:hypothetical protein